MILIEQAFQRSGELPEYARFDGFDPNQALSVDLRGLE